VYRVIQWATGAMGRATLRTVIDHPDTELVGVFTYSPDKAGRDAGELAGRPPTGVLATSDLDTLLALDADVVVHAGMLKPYAEHVDDYVALLASGKNVLSLNGGSDPEHWGGEHLRRLEEACAAGGSSIMGCGMNPGVLIEQLAPTAAGMCSDLERIEMTESFDCREIRNPAYLFTMLGFGSPVDQDPNDPQWGPTAALHPMYEEALAALAARLGTRLRSVRTEHRLLPAIQDLVLPAGTVVAGTVGHTRWRWVGTTDADQVLALTIHWFLETAHLDSVPEMWSVEIEGQPCVSLSAEVRKHPADRSRMGPEQYAVGGLVVNALPHVVEAPPGPVLRPLSTPYRTIPS
jgi:2,4-diaminopentanoate dehydrogenase